MSQENYIELGKLIKVLEQKLLESSLEVQSAELELQVVVNQENGDLRIFVLDSETDADWKNLHTLRLKVFKGKDEPPGGSGSKPKSSSGDPLPQTKIDNASEPMGGGPGEPPGGPGELPGGSGGSDGSDGSSKPR